MASRAQIGALHVNLSADTGEFNRDLRGAQGRLRSLGRDARGTSRTMGRSFGPAIQQAGFQVGDFAVQVASGQSAMRAFIQQGSQLLGFFGTWGAVAGAALAVTGAIGASLIGLGNATDEASEKTDNFTGNLSGAESQISGLVGVATEYARAIRDTGPAQVGATNIIVAQTRREFEARKTLLELDRDARIAAIADQRGKIALIKNEAAVALRELSRLERSRARVVRKVPGASPEEVTNIFGPGNQARLDELKNKVPEFTAQIREMNAETSLAVIAVEKLNSALDLTFADLADDADTGTASVSRQNKAIAKTTSLFDEQRQMLAKLSEQRKQRAEEEARLMEDNRIRWASLGRSFAREFTGLTNAATDSFRSFGERILGLANRMVDRIIEDAFSRLFENFGAGGGGGILGSIIGGIGGLFGLAASSPGAGNLLTSPPAIPQSGTIASPFNFASGADFIVGGAPGVDKNFVPMNLSRGERVQITPANQSAGGGTYYIDARGADQAAVGRLQSALAQLTDPARIRSIALDGMFDARVRDPRFAGGR